VREDGKGEGEEGRGPQEKVRMERDGMAAPPKVVVSNWQQI
jgi:hypothetical protein